MKFILKFKVFLLLLIGLESCKKNQDDSYFNAPFESKTDIKYDGLKLDTIELKNLETSFDYILKIKGDSMYYVDRRFGWVYVLDKSGNRKNKHLGQGKGPNELNTGIVDVFQPINSGFIFIGAGDDCHLFNNKWERKDIFTIDKGITPSTDLKNVKKINADMKWVYTKCYPKLITRNYNDYLYYTIYAEHPNFNMVEHRDYYLNGRIIAKLNSQNGNLEEILGRVSPLYQKYNYIPQFTLPSFDISDNGEFYICYEADSVIYKYDKNFRIMNAFGIKGNNMNLSYKEISTINEFTKIVEEQREKCGYYNYIEYIDERNLLFRSYTKGNKEKTDGLQLYKKETLIGDFDVPEGFKVIGYIAPYFFSDIYVDEEKGEMKIYRFKINEL